MSMYKKAFSVAALTGAALAMSGCATTGTHFPSATDPIDSSVTNAPENRGTKEYGSQACRDAKVDVVEGRALNSYRSNQAYAPFFRSYAQPQFRQAVTVVSNKTGVPYTLVSKDSDSPVFTIVGAGVGAYAGKEVAGRGARGAAGALAGAGILGYAGKMLDNALSAGTREAFDRCRADTANGAYDTATGAYAPRTNVPAPAANCPAGYTCVPQGQQFKGDRRYTPQ